MSFIKYVKRGFRYVLTGQPVHYTNVTVHTMAPNQVLHDRNILITGGGRGLGFHIAKKCISEGAKVIITGRNQKTLCEAKKQLGDHCEYIVHDNIDISRIPVLFDEAELLMNHKMIDSLVCNAGISLHEGDFHHVTEDTWDAQMDINLKSNYFFTKYFVEYYENKLRSHLTYGRSGNIVIISSERAKRSDDIPYGLTKAALSSFIQAIAAKTINLDIRINGVGPGVTATYMTGFKAGGNMYNSWQNNQRIFLPEEIAEVVNFLLSDISGCISGEIITCDQGNYISHW